MSSNNGSGVWWMDDMTSLMNECGLLEFDQLEACIKQRGAHISGYRVFITYGCSGPLPCHSPHITTAWDGP